MKSEKIKYETLFNKTEKVDFVISKELFKLYYIKYLEKRRSLELPIEQDLKLRQFVKQSYYCQLLWFIEREIKDPIVKELFN